MDDSARKAKGCMLVFIIPIGVFLFSVFFELGNTYYWQKKLDKVTESILVDVMNTASIDTKEEIELYAREKLDSNGFENPIITVTFIYEDLDGCDPSINPNDPHVCQSETLMLSNQIEHFSVTGYVSYMFRRTSTDKKYTISRYKGYLDEYNEPVVEKVEYDTDANDRVYTDEELKEMETSE